MSGKIDAVDLRFKYRGQGEDTPFILDGVNLSVQEGEFVAVLGRNGCGKSTLAKQFCALLLPSGGHVYIDGIDTADEENIEKIHRIVGMIFQNPDNQIVSSIVEEDVAFGPENLNLPPNEIKERVEEALNIVEMAGYHQHATHKLSGGQKQRIAIAGIIAMRPKCIVLDEPTSMLDPQGAGGSDAHYPQTERGSRHHHRAHHALYGRGGFSWPRGGHGRGQDIIRR